MNITIRKSTINDAAALSTLFIEFMGCESNIQKMKSVIETINENVHYYVPVACIGSNVVGFAMGIVCYDICGTCEPFILVEDVVVLPDYRSLGVGKALMNAIEVFGTENNCKYSILVSEPSRTASHKFYESLDYHLEMGFKKRLD